MCLAPSAVLMSHNPHHHPSYSQPITRPAPRTQHLPILSHPIPHHSHHHHPQHNQQPHQPLQRHHLPHHLPHHHHANNTQPSPPPPPQQQPQSPHSPQTPQLQPHQQQPNQPNNNNNRQQQQHHTPHSQSTLPRPSPLSTTTPTESTTTHSYTLPQTTSADPVLRPPNSDYLFNDISPVAPPPSEPLDIHTLLPSNSNNLPQYPHRQQPAFQSTPSNYAHPVVDSNRANNQVHTQQPSQSPHSQQQHLGPPPSHHHPQQQSPQQSSQHQQQPQQQQHVQNTQPQQQQQHHQSQQSNQPVTTQSLWQVPPMSMPTTTHLQQDGGGQHYSGPNTMQPHHDASRHHVFQLSQVSSRSNALSDVMPAPALPSQQQAQHGATDFAPGGVVGGNDGRSNATMADASMMGVGRSNEDNEDEPRLDRRVGKDRVQRPCHSCGHLNHIRKNNCHECDAPKQAAKKRPPRRKKKSKRTSMMPQSGMMALNQQYVGSASPHVSHVYNQSPSQHHLPQTEQHAYMPSIVPAQQQQLHVGGGGGGGGSHMATALQPLQEPSRADINRRPIPEFSIGYESGGFPMLSGVHTTHSFGQAGLGTQQNQGGGGGVGGGSGGGGVVGGGGSGGTGTTATTGNTVGGGGVAGNVSGDQGGRTQSGSNDLQQQHGGGSHQHQRLVSPSATGGHCSLQVGGQHGGDSAGGGGSAGGGSGSGSGGGGQTQSRSPIHHGLGTGGSGGTLHEQSQQRMSHAVGQGSGGGVTDQGRVVTGIEGSVGQMGGASGDGGEQGRQQQQVQR